MERKQDTGKCDHCHESFRYYLIHNGFNDSVYSYCDLCGVTADISLWSPVFSKLPIGTPKQGVIPEGLEPFLESCSCGGRFTSRSAPHCPKCNQGLSADKAAIWIEENAPGTSGGWRWQRNWNGLYCIVIENRVIHNNFVDIS